MEHMDVLKINGDDDDGLGLAYVDALDLHAWRRKEG